MYWSFCFVSMLMVVLEGLLSYRDMFFSTAQMERRGYAVGTPFLKHGGMWADFFLISPLVAYIVGHYRHDWTYKPVVIALVVGYAISSVMHVTYKRGGIRVPNWAAHGGELTMAGVMHAAYMGWVLAILLAFYFATPIVSARSAEIVTVALMVHLVLGVIQPAIVAGDRLSAPSVWPTLVVSYATLAGGYAYLIFR